MTTASDYAAWYDTPRGQWIGDTEFDLLRQLLRPEVGATLLDVGCGTGYFTHRFAAECDLTVTGVDPEDSWLDYAKAHAAGTENYVPGRAESLPFPDRSFDCSASVTALCFIADARRAIEEMLRVTRRRFVIGLLNRCSLLYWQKGRDGGTGAYRDARWHTVAEVRALFAGLPVDNLVLRTAVFVPSGGAIARAVEPLIPGRLPLGAFLVIAGAVSASTASST